MPLSEGYVECLPSSLLSNGSCAIASVCCPKTRWDGHISHLHREWEYIRQFLILMIFPISRLFVWNIFIIQLFGQSVGVTSNRKSLFCKKVSVSIYIFLFHILPLSKLMPFSTYGIGTYSISSFEIFFVHPHRLFYCLALQYFLHKVISLKHLFMGLFSSFLYSRRNAFLNSLW